MVSRHAGCIGSDQIDYGQLHVGDIFNGLPFPDELQLTLTHNGTKAGPRLDPGQLFTKTTDRYLE
jgi:hypothetical protein